MPWDGDNDEDLDEDEDDERSPRIKFKSEVQIEQRKESLKAKSPGSSTRRRLMKKGSSTDNVSE